MRQDTTITKIFFILFLFFTLHYSLLARDALPILVQDGEKFNNKEDFYILHKIPITAIAVSSDGKIIVSGLTDNTIKIWDIQSTKLLKSLSGHTSIIRSIVISSNGKIIVSASKDNTIKIWDRYTGELLKSLKGHKLSVNSIAISRDGKIIVSGSDDNSIKIWDVQSGTELKSLYGHKGWVNTVIIHGKIIVSGSTDNTIKIWDVNTGKLLKSLKGHKLSVNSVSISRDGKTIVSGSGDRTIKIWDVNTGKLLKNLVGHTDWINTVIINKDDKIIISCSNDKSIKIWDIETGKLLKNLNGHTDRVKDIDINFNHKIIISASSDSRIKIWDYKNRKELKSLNGHTSSVSSVSITSDGNTMVSGLRDNSIKIWDVKNGKELKTLERHTDWINKVVIGFNGETIISASRDNSIKIWDVKNGKELNSLKGHTDIVTSVTISHNGKRIVSGSSDKSIKIWDFKSGKELRSLVGHTNYITSVAISSDDKIIVSGSIDNTIKIWDFKSGKELNSLIGHTNGVYSVAISSDSKTIVSGSDDNSIKIWDVKSGKILNSLDGHISTVLSVDISKDNTIIVSGSDDNSIKIWDLKSGKELNNLVGHTSSVTSVAISSDGKTIISGSDDGTICVWDIKIGKKLKEYISGENGSWIVFDYEKNRLFRGDDGTLLYKKDGASLSLALPLLPKEDSVAPKGSHHISTINEKLYSYNINIKNQVQNPLYWVKTSYHDNYCTIIEQRLSNLKPQEEQNLTLTLNCSLPQKNPKPITHKINLTLETATGSKFEVPLSISIRYADINISQVERSEDGKNLNIKIHNSGNEKITKANVRLIEPFENNATQEIVNLEANQSVDISYVLPTKDGKPMSLEDKSLSLEVIVPNTKLEKENPNVEVAPSYVWHIEDVTISLNKMAWYLYALMLLVGLFLLWSVWYYRRYKNPLVVKLQNDPTSLLTLNPKLLEEAKERLSTINQWETILKSVNITQTRFDETTTFFKSTSKDKAKLIAKRLGAECYQEGEFFRVNMPKSFDLNIDTFLLHFPKEELKKEILDEHDKVLVIANEEYLKETHKLATDRTNRLIAPTEQKLTEFLLSGESERVLIDIFAECLLFKDISPYQVNSGVNNESNFFGRVEIIRDIITKENANYLIVGARQLGKSSIIKALERRYEGSSKVECYSFTMEDENIVLAMSRALGMEGEPTLDEVVSAIANAPKKSVFLIDEADRFAKHEKEVDYEVTEAFRKLSQEGKATFVLTGFWTLYFAVTSDYHSPLKNFGELIKLEGLDHNACRDLMIEPMKRIGVSYESESIVENVIEFCGRRPNLIAITCNEVLKKLEGKVITQADIDEVVENSSLEDYLKGWGSMSENEADNRLDRVIIYLTLEKESFRLADIDAWLKEQGKKIDANRIKSSLERLVVGYILEERKKNYSYRVPLFREKLLEDDIEILLDGDLEQL